VLMSGVGGNDRRVMEVVGRVLAAKVSERAGVVERECAGDAGLRARVEEMVRQQEMRTITPTGEGGAEGAEVGSPLSKLSLPGGEMGGRKFGRYRILEVLGEGGMGTVYLAEQDSPRRKVALKVIRAGLLSRANVKRFEAESAVLGRLHHPGIAQIYEAGTAVVDGIETPFLAMEYVRGVPLTEFADSHALGVRERLGLMAMVCDAVQHAHTKGVIHRDLKPGNVLVEEVGEEVTKKRSDEVTKLEGASRFHSVTSTLRHSVTSLTGAPKVLDFGIARVTDADVQLATMRTEVGQLVGTIPYMSPEQVAGDPGALDTRSDVYTLGVMLYELLAGRLPHEVSGKTIPEAVRMISEQPATPLGSVDAKFRGEIQTIVEKAIEKEKWRRYQSARDLADDIRRHLHDEPIAARPASAAYRFSKFAKRNKGLVSGMSVAAVVLALGVVGVAWQAARATAGWSQAEKNLAAATEAQRHAEEEAANAKGVSAFLTSMLTAVDPETAIGRDTTARELLDAAVLTLDHTRPDTPLVEVTIRGAISQSYRGIGHSELAEPQIRAAYTLAKEKFGDDDQGTLEARRNLAIVLMEQGKFEEAERIAQENATRAERVFGDTHVITAQTRGELARLMAETGRLKEARALYEPARDVMVRELGPEHKDVLSVKNNIATIYKALGMLEEAEAIQREVVAAHEKVLPAEHPQLLSAQNNLATVLQRRGKNKEAADVFARTLAARIKVLGEDHVSTATTRLNLAVCLVADGKQAEAEPLVRRSMAVYEAKLGQDHPKTLTAYGNLAYILEDLGNAAEAETWFRRVLAGLKKNTTGGADPEMWSAINNLAMLLMKEGKLDEASEQFRDLIQTCEPTVPADHPFLAIFRNNYGECLTRQHVYESAEAELLKSQRVLEKKLGAEHPRTVKGAGRLAALYQEWGKPEQAATWKK
jgi:eukaryotic-like serine/threonine-protein kinase